MRTTVQLFVDTEQTYLWSNVEKAPIWRFNSANAQKVARARRILTNAVKSYHSMLIGRYGVTDIMLETNSEMGFPYPTTYFSYSDMFIAKESLKAPLTSIHPPFFSRAEIDWSANADSVQSHHLYVDASVCVDTADEIPVSSYAIHTSDGTQVRKLDATSSVDAEYQALQIAVMQAAKRAKQLGKKVVVFADCCPAIVKVAMKREEGEHPYLGQSVFIQWLPGHQGYEGMFIVDKAAREKVREMMA